MPIVVISLDGIKDIEIEKMAADAVRYPNIAAFFGAARYTGGVRTTFVSNTYPIHTAVGTRELSRDNGVISNILKTTEGGDVWAQEASLIKRPTLFDLAAQKGLKVAALAWPVTCGANINRNLPEVHPLKGQNRLWQHMRHGSAFFQLSAFLKHGKKLDGLKQPQLDDFLTSIAVDLLNRKRRPDMLFLHILAYDFICHDVGICDALDVARASVDASLGRILRAAGDDATVIVFSDHGHLNVHTTVNLQAEYGDRLFEQCGGSAFFTHDAEGVEDKPWFERFLTEHEMDVSGYAARAKYGIAAKVGFCFGTRQYAGNHGYPVDYDCYNVFYAIKGAKNAPPQIKFNDIRDVGELIAHEMEAFNLK